MTLYLDRPVYGPFLKVADVRLPYDSDKWEEEIIEALHEQHPYLPDARIRMSINVKNVKLGYAIGNVNVDDRIRIPIIIDRFQLKPFDVFLSRGDLRPMNKNAVLAELETRNFGEPTRPGQGESSDIFMTNARPPYDGKYTFAAWTEGDPKKVEESLTNVFGPDKVEYFLHGDPIVKDILDKAHKNEFKGMKHDGAVKELKENDQRKNIVKSAAMEIPISKMERLVAGVVKVADSSGNLVNALLCDRVYDVCWGTQELPMLIPGDSSAYDMDRAFVGQQMLKAAELDVHALATDKPNVEQVGVFFWKEHDKLACTSIVKIGYVEDHIEYGVFDSRNTNRPTSTIKLSEDVAAASISKSNVITIPATARWVPVTNKHAVYGRPVLADRDFILVQEARGNYKIAVFKSDIQKFAADTLLQSQAENWLGTYFEPESVVTILNKAKNSGSVKLAAVPAIFDAIDASTRPMVDRAAAINRIREQAKIAARAVFAIAESPINTEILKPYVEKFAKIEPVWAFIIKEALNADEDRVDSVDSALGLNILNEQNVSKFMDGIDGLENCRRFCLKILLAARLGLPVDPDAARTAANALDHMIQDLRQVQGMSPYNPIKD